MARYQEDYNLLSLSAKCIECVVNEFNDLDEVSAKFLYADILTAVKEVVSDDKIDCLTNLSLVLSEISKIANDECLKNYQHSDRIGNFNLVSMACKNKANKALEYIFSDEQQTLYNLSTQISGFPKNEMLLSAKDEFNHNAFYYAIRSNMTNLLSTLVEKWRSQCINEELDDILSQSYKELKLRNVSVSKEMLMFVQSKILDLQSFHTKTARSGETGKSLIQIEKRINLVVRYIRSIKNDYWDQDPDEKFIFIAEFIAKSIHTLKTLLRSSYDRLPWEEIEFCLLIFIRCCKNSTEPNLVYNCVLNKKQLLMHLFNFSVVLCAQHGTFENCNKHVILPRDDVVDKIIENNNEFRELYDDYEKIRNFRSLEIIKNYADLIESSDATGNRRHLLILRVLQVMGEHLKNTLESPKLSTEAANALLSFLPSGTREILTKLRNTLSHEDALCIRSEIEKKTHLFKNIQTDISKISGVIPKILLSIRTASIKNLMKKVKLCESIENIREYFGPYRYSVDLYAKEMENCSLSTLIMGCFQRLEELLMCFDEVINDKTISERILFKQMHHLIHKEKERFQNLKQTFRHNVVHYFDLYVVSKDSSGRYIDKMANAISNLPSDVLPSLTIKQVGKLFYELLIGVFVRKFQPTHEKVNDIILEIFVFLHFELGCAKWIKELSNIMNQNVYNEASSPKLNPNLSENLLTSKLSLLKEAFIGFDLKDGTSSTDFSSFESNMELQAVTEMLLLDILCILESSGCRNQFFLDNDYPLLSGKNLRNHLAHKNTFIDVCLEESSTQLLIYVKKVLTATFPNNNMKIDRVIKRDCIKLESIIDYNLQIINNQRNLFVALGEGNVKDAEECVNGGADVYGKDGISSTSLHFAVRAPDTTALKWILKQGLNTNSKNIAGENLLHIAAKFNRTEVMRYLIEQEHMSLVDSNANGKTPLHVAVENQSNQVVEYITKFEISITRKDKYGSTPLHTAIYRHNIDAAKILLEKERDINEHKSFAGYTVLHIATLSENFILVELLLAKKAIIDSKSDFGQTPLHTATYTRHLEIVKALVENGADVNAKDEIGASPLKNAAIVGSTEIVNFLLEHGADINVSNNLQETPLMIAAKNGQASVTELLLQKGAFINSKDNFGSAPLHFAAQWGRYETVELLLNHKAVIDCRNNANLTALHLSAAGGHKEVVKLLLKEGADINATESTNSTPLQIAVAHGHKDIVFLLIANGADINSTNEAGSTALHLAALNGDKIIVESLLKNGANIRANDANKTTLLYLLISEGLLDILTLERRDLNSSDASGYTLLHLAALNGDQMIVEHCIEKDCDINAQSNSGSTSLHLASGGNHKKIVSCLLSNGAEIDAVDDNGFTPLLYSVKCNCKETLEILLSFKMNDCKSMTDDKIKALEISVLFGYSDTVDILLQSYKFDITNELKQKLLLSAIKCNHKQVVAILLKRGFEVNGNAKPLHVATHRRHYDLVEFLLTKGANPNLLDEYNCTPVDIAVKSADSDMLEIFLCEKAYIPIESNLIFSAAKYAASSNQLDTIKLLLQMKVVNADAIDDDGYTLLHICAFSGSLDVTRYLVVEGADINAKDRENRKPVHIATEKGFKDMVAFYLNCNDLGNETAELLLIAASNGKASICELLIKRNADVNSFQTDTVTPVTLMLVKGDKEVLSVLLNYGAYYNAHPSALLKQAKDNDAASLLRKVKKLFFVVKNKAASSVKNLLKEESSSEYCFANGKCVRKETVLHYSSWKGYEEMIDILLEYNTNPNGRTKTGCTPLHYAVNFRHFNIVKALLSNGAMYNVLSQAGKTPLDYATEREIRNFLLFMKEIFTKVQDNDLSVLENLKGKDKITMKATIRAKNQEGKTLIEVAYLCGFLKTDELQMLFQTDLVHEIKSANKSLDENKYSEALSAFEKILRKKGAIFGADSHPVLDAKVKLAKIYENLGEMDKTLYLLREVHEKRKGSLGEVHLKTLSDKTLIAFYLTKKGETREALHIFERVHTKLKEKLQPDDLKMINFEKVFTSSLLRMKKFDEVLKLSKEFEQKCVMKKDNQYRLEQTCFQFCMAEALLKQAKYSEAMRLYEEVYKTRKCILTPDLLKWRSLKGIALVLDRQEKYGESLEVFCEVLDIQRSYLPADHIDILASEFHIGDALYNQGMHLRALKIFLTLEPKFAVAQDSGMIKPNKERIDIIKREFSAFGWQCVIERMQNHVKESD